MAKLVSRK